MPLILSIETATDICSVALTEGTVLLNSISLTEKNVHSARLALLIQELVSGSNKQMNDLNAIAISKGPGSFTGLRIGVSVGKGIAYGLEIPIIGISTLESIAFGASLLQGNTSFVWCPVIDARNQEVYYALYDSEIMEVQAADAGLIDHNSFSDLGIKDKIRFIGPAVDSETIPRLISSKEDCIYGIKPDAVNIAHLAYKRFMANEFEDITFFEPFYLRDFKAKNLSTRIKKVLNYRNNQ
jgi:tRNA threonylcarbamoyladenosine biosynthesis protein TsaB